MSAKHVDALLPEFVLGTLAEADLAEVEAHLASCPKCATDCLATQEALALFSFAAPPERAPGAGRDRLLDATRAANAQGNRWQLLDKMAEFFDVSVNAARAILEKASNPAAWEPGPIPGMHLFHLQPGPAYAAADAGLIRFEGGVAFPKHTHLGLEHTLMLEGGVALDDGTHLRAGDRLVKPAGSAHAYTVHPEGCLFALVLYTGVDIEGVGPLTTSKK
jgi:anti-sigma factor ChrR (cupin superfamily)